MSAAPIFKKRHGVSQIDIGMSEVFFVVVDWILAQGVAPLHTVPGVWHGQTQAVDDDLGVLDVRLNAHNHEIDGIPAYAVAIGKDDTFPGLIAMVQALGGIIIDSGTPGEDEAGLLHHFRSQPAPMPKETMQ